MYLEKIGRGHYKIGDKIVEIAISNGILLVKTGGGFMEIASYYNLYSEQEEMKRARSVSMLTADEDGGNYQKDNRSNIFLNSGGAVDLHSSSSDVNTHQNPYPSFHSRAGD